MIWINFNIPCATEFSQENTVYIKGLRAAHNHLAGRMQPAGRSLGTPVLEGQNLLDSILDIYDRR